MNTFPKSEKLCLESRIDLLFAKGKRGGAGVVRYCVLERDEPGVAVMFSVPKKIFKRAWKRNLVRRRMRESYRVRKNALEGRGLDIAFICAPTAEIPDFQQIDGAIRKILERISVGRR